MEFDLFLFHFQDQEFVNMFEENVNTSIAVDYNNVKNKYAHDLHLAWQIFFFFKVMSVQQCTVVSILVILHFFSGKMATHGQTLHNLPANILTQSNKLYHLKLVIIIIYHYCIIFIIIILIIICLVFIFLSLGLILWFVSVESFLNLS